ncbi:MAG: SGNH/GDSL hydrolase family protein [bacterium]
MLGRRAFLKSGAVAAGATAFCGTVQAAEACNKPAGVRGYSYRLPKFKAGARLVFQGDSITDMLWGRNESDRNHYLGHSYVYLIASRLGVDRPEDKLEFFNRGVSGNGISDLKQRWQKDAIEMKPDLLSVLVGVNDVGRLSNGVTPKQWEDDYRYLLDASRKATPDLKLVLLDPFVLASGRLANAGEYTKWREKIDLMTPVVAQLAKDYSAVHIKTQSVFDAAAKEVSPEHWIWDGVHPLPQGHELIARNWLEEVSARWNKV